MAETATTTSPLQSDHQAAPLPFPRCPPYSPPSPLPLPLHPLSNRAPWPPNFIAGAPPRRRGNPPPPITRVSPSRPFLVHFVFPIVAHLPDIVSDFMPQPIDVDVHDRTSPPPRASPVAPPRCSRSFPTSSHRHPLHLIPAHVVVVFSKRGNHRSALALDVRAVRRRALSFR